MTNMTPEICLDDYGITRGISEVIITTKGPTGENAAPIGVIRRKNNAFLRLYPGSHTYENIRETGQVVANVSHDPMVFVETAFNDSHLSFDQWNDMPVLPTPAAEAHVLFTVHEDQRGGETTIFDLRAVDARRGEVILRAVNRGFYAVIEATVHATRYQELGDQIYLDKIDYYADLVGRCGNPRDREAMNRLLEIVEMIR